MKPLSRAQTDIFFGTVGSALEEAPEGSRMILAGWEPEGAVVLAMGGNDPGAIAAADQLVAMKPPALAAALRVHWAQLPEEETEPAWLLIIIVPGRSGQFGVKRDTEDRWWKLRPTEVPWLGLSTAGSLRAALEQGQPLRIKQAKDQRLFNKVYEGDQPPVDEQGML